jgi:multidrug efflux system outer membrane protein
MFFAVFLHYRLKILLLSSAFILLSGCAVSLQPVSEQELEEIALSDIQLIYSSQEPIESPLTLEQAMSRSLKYNLENRLTLLEQVLTNRSLDLAKRDMLPQLAASAGYLDRSNIDASRSQSVLTGRESLEPSTSQDRERDNADIRFTWNLLDFGVSYLQAKQDADRYLISQSARKKTMLRLLDQVRYAYWRTVGMQSVESDLEEITLRVNTMLENLEQVRQEQLRTPVAILNDIRTLLETQQQLERVRQSINQANVELASLINEPPSAALEVTIPDTLLRPIEISSDLEELERYALSQSPDYESQLYNVRIDQVESRKALIRLLPGLEFSYGYNYNDNSFLWNDQWGEVGIRLTGDITQLINSNRIRNYNTAREALAQTRRLAINMAVIAGVHLTWQDYYNALNSLDYANKLSDIDQEISEISINATVSNAGSEAEAIQNELRAFRSRMEQILSYAEMQGAYGSLLVSLGFNPIPDQYQNMSVDQFANYLKQSFSSWERGMSQNLDTENITGNNTVAVSPLLSTSAEISAGTEDREQEFGMTSSKNTSDSLLVSLNEIHEPVELSVNSWLTAWRNKRMVDYFGNYHPEFNSRYHATNDIWRRDREETIFEASDLEVVTSDMEFVDLAEDLVEVRFWLTYRSVNYADNTLKQLIMKKENDQWLIAEEINLQINYL